MELISIHIRLQRQDLSMFEIRLFLLMLESGCGYQLDKLTIQDNRLLVVNINMLLYHNSIMVIVRLRILFIHSESVQEFECGKILR